MASLLVVALCLGAGALLRDRIDPAPLNAYVLQFALPALTIVKMHDAPALPIAAVASVWVVFLVAGLFFGALGRAVGWDRATIGCLTLACGLSNTSFVGFPLLEWLLGPEAVARALPLDQLGSFVLVATLAPAFAAHAAADGRPLGSEASWKALVLAPLRFPTLWALLAARTLPSEAWPTPLLSACEQLAATVSPVALVAVGAQLRLPERASGGPFAVGLLYKLAIAPIVAWAWVVAFRVDASMTKVAVLEAAMAPMVSGALIAQRYGLRPELAAALLGVGVPLSIVTVWGWSVWVG